MAEKLLRTPEEEDEEAHRRLFVLQVVQPGLAGLMDGSVSTLAPLFAAAFATHHLGRCFPCRPGGQLGAGISMGFAEALSDDGSLTGSRPAVGTGFRLRLDDGSRRAGPYAAVSYSRLALFLGNWSGGRRGDCRTGNHRLDTQSLHGYAALASGIADCRRRRTGFRHRHSDREFVRGFSTEQSFKAFGFPKERTREARIKQTVIDQFEYARHHEGRSASIGLATSKPTTAGDNAAPAVRATPVTPAAADRSSGRTTAWV